MKRDLQAAFAKAAPQFTIRLADDRAGIECLETPALMLLDLVSGEPAIELVEWFRAHTRYQNVPVIAFGSDGMDHYMERAYALGVNSCLLKTSRLSPIVRGLAKYVSLVRTAGAGTANGGPVSGMRIPPSDSLPA